MLKALNMLMDASPDEGQLNEILEVAEKVNGIKQVSWVKGRFVGRHLMVDMAIEVEGNLSVEEGHCIALAVENCIVEEIKDVNEVLIHVNPV